MEHEVIVHFSLNEKEATLPIETYQPDGAKKSSTAKYYLWSDVKSYWNDILACSPDSLSLERFLPQNCSGESRRERG